MRGVSPLKSVHEQLPLSSCLHTNTAISCGLHTSPNSHSAVTAPFELLRACTCVRVCVCACLLFIGSPCSALKKRHGSFSGSTVLSGWRWSTSIFGPLITRQSNKFNSRYSKPKLPIWGTSNRGGTRRRASEGFFYCRSSTTTE